MKIHDAVAPLATPAVRSSLSHAGNWMRELEQAQTWNWFHGALTAPAGGPSVGPRRPSLAATSGNCGPASFWPAAESALPQGSSTLPQAQSARISGPPRVQLASEPGAIAVPRQAPALAWSTPDAPVTADEHSPETSQEAPTRGGEPSSRPASDADARVHLEATQEGVALWFGIDGDPGLVAVRASALLSGLRRDLASTGQRIAVVVCNGQAMDPFTSTRPKELP